MEIIESFPRFMLCPVSIQLRTVSRPDDAPQLHVLSQLDGASRLDAAREEGGAGQLPEQADLAQKVVAAAQVNRRGYLVHAERKKRGIHFRPRK